jgi:hypothetical protein
LWAWLSAVWNDPESRAVQTPEAGRIVAIPELGGSIIGMNVAPPERAPTWS